MITPFRKVDTDPLKREKSNIMDEINLVSTAYLQPPLNEGTLIKELVAQFLRHDGYVDTANAFAEETRAEMKALDSDFDESRDSFRPQEDLDAVNRQSKVFLHLTNNKPQS